MESKVLLVDDEEKVLFGLRRQMMDCSFELFLANSGEKALETLAAEGPFAVILADMTMPQMNGIELLSSVRKKHPDTVRMMLTGNADQKTAIDAVNEGNVFRFFNKPCAVPVLIRGIEGGIEQYRLVRAEKELLEQTLAGSIKVLADIMSMRHPEVFGRGMRIRAWARRVLRTLERTNAWQLDLAAMLYQIGLMVVPHEILLKSNGGTALSGDEQAMIERMPETGRNLLSSIPRMEEVAEIIYYQRKDYGGTGFPADDVAGDDIPFGARLLRILTDLADAGDGDPTESDFFSFEQANGVYDQELLKVVKSTLCEDGSDEDAKGKLSEVTLHQMRPGMELMRDITSDDGTLILAKGVELSEPKIERLRNLAMTRRIAAKVLVREKPPEKTE